MYIIKIILIIIESSLCISITYLYHAKSTNKLEFTLPKYSTLGQRSANKKLKKKIGSFLQLRTRRPTHKTLHIFDCLQPVTNNEKLEGTEGKRQARKTLKNGMVGISVWQGNFKILLE